MCNGQILPHPKMLRHHHSPPPNLQISGTLFSLIVISQVANGACCPGWRLPWQHGHHHQGESWWLVITGVSLPGRWEWALWHMWGVMMGSDFLYIKWQLPADFGEVRKHMSPLNYTKQQSAPGVCWVAIATSVSSFNVWTECTLCFPLITHAGKGMSRIFTRTPHAVTSKFNMIEQFAQQLSTIGHQWAGMLMYIWKTQEAVAREQKCR